MLTKKLPECVGFCPFTVRQLRKLRTCTSHDDDPLYDPNGGTGGGDVYLKHFIAVSTGAPLPTDKMPDPPELGMTVGDAKHLVAAGTLDEGAIVTTHLYAQDWDLMSEDIPGFDRWFYTLLFVRDPKFGEDKMTKEDYFDKFVKPVGVGMTEDECIEWCAESERQENEEEELESKLSVAVYNYGQARVREELIGIGETNKGGPHDSVPGGKWEWVWVSDEYCFIAIGKPLSGGGVVIGLSRFDNEYEYLISKEFRHNFIRRLDSREPGLIDWHKNMCVKRFSRNEAQRLAQLLDRPTPKIEARVRRHPKQVMFVEDLVVGSEYARVINVGGREPSVVFMNFAGVFIDTEKAIKERGVPVDDGVEPFEWVLSSNCDYKGLSRITEPTGAQVEFTIHLDGWRGSTIMYWKDGGREGHDNLNGYLDTKECRSTNGGSLLFVEAESWRTEPRCLIDNKIYKQINYLLHSQSEGYPQCDDPECGCSEYASGMDPSRIWAWYEPIGYACTITVKTKNGGNNKTTSIAPKVAHETAAEILRILES